MESGHNIANRDECAGLMERVADGDAAAFEQLYRSHWEYVKTYLAKTCGYRGRLSDLTQEVFMRIWAHRHTYSPEAAFKTYLVSYAYRVMLEEHDRQWKMRTLHGRYLRHTRHISGYSHSAESQIVAREVRGLLMLAIEKLPLLQREAVWLFYIEQMSLAQGSRSAGCTLKAFANRLDRARRRLKSLLPDVDCQ